MAVVCLCFKEAFKVYGNKYDAFNMLGKPFHKQM